MKIKLWGVRGSLPTPPLPEEVEARIRGLFRAFFKAGNKELGQVEAFLASLPPPDFGGYGGNTPCIEVITDRSQVIINGGTGIRRLGYELMRGPCGQGKGEVHIVFTHFHWDHLVGLPFFNPIFIPGNVIHAYAVQPELPDVFKNLFRKPYFPVNLADLGAKIIYHQLEKRKSFSIGDMTLTPYQLDHPDPCWGYRFEKDGKVFSHCVDTECTRATREELGPDLPLYQGVDLMTFDAQYTLFEAIEKVNWGHAAASIGLDIAMREGVKRIVFMHHDPAASDEKIAAAQTQAGRYYNGQHKSSARSGLTDLHQVDWTFAIEGMTFDL